MSAYIYYNGTNIYTKNDLMFMCPSVGGYYAVYIEVGVVNTHIEDNVANQYDDGFINDLGTETTQVGNMNDGVYTP